MNEHRSIELSRLTDALNLILSHIEQSAGPEFTLTDDYFWRVPSSSLYDVTEHPRDLTVGRLTESWRRVEEMLSGERDVVGYGLVWLADLLRAVGSDIVR